jgi:hypothetical protein
MSSSVKRGVGGLFLSATTLFLALSLQAEPLGECSRRTGLVLSEIMYHPTNSNLEFIELFNSRGEPQDLSGYQLSGSVDYTFPAGSQIAGEGFVVVARAPGDLQSTYGLTSVFGPYTNNLPNSKGTVRLLSQAGAVLLEANYDSVPPWPIAADGAGHSLVLARSSYGENNVEAWAASDSVGGSPGGLDPVSNDPLRQVVINEFLADNGPSSAAFIELFNTANDALDVSGCSLTDDPKTNKFVLATGTTIPARGFLVYDALTLGFAPQPSGGTLYFRGSTGERVLDALRYEGQQLGASFGRTPDGSKRLQALALPTPGTNNSPAWHGAIVINEIMYSPISLNDDDQYIELYNRGSNSVDLSGWQFVSGIDFTFPTNTVIAPDGYFVVARNASRMQTNYANLNSGNLIGNFAGALSHRGERLALAMPQAVSVSDGQGGWTTNIVYPVVSEVSYQSGGQWGQWSDAGGSSLELIDPRADNDLAPNWADSDETHKAAWTLISATGTIDNGNVAADELQVLLEGMGEALVDEVQVIDNTGSNRIANGTFESGSGGWVGEGTEKTSSLESNEGYNSTRSYHLRAVEKGDTQINRVRVSLTSPLTAGTTNVTIRAEVRWLKGSPSLAMRLRGNWLECAADLPTPPNLGTPGMRNSRFIGNAPPAITDVQPSPVLPAANEPILVTAQISDPDGLGSVVLKYRLDPGLTYASIPMTDDGTGGDVLAGDGIWSAVIPGQASGTLVAFYLQATDKFSTPATAVFPSGAPSRECLARVGEIQPTGNFPVYRLWLTQSNANTWNSNSKLDNSFYDTTFVVGNQRVIYNSGARYKGSPFISPSYCGLTCGRCGYTLTFPADNLFLGENELVLDWAGGHGGETTALQEQMCYWIADRINLPWSYRHTIRLHVNGVTDDTRKTTFEAVVQPDGSFVNEWVPNDNAGELYKIEDAFEFNDSGSLVADPDPRLQPYTTTGGLKKRERYRWNFMFRSTDRRNDYTNLFALVDAVNAKGPEPYNSATLGLVDMEEWMGIFATEHIIENFDAYGHEIGKNMYAYLPRNGKWQLFMFDLDWAMLAAPLHSSSYTASQGPLFNSEDPTISRMYAFPPFVRAYWRAVQNAVNGPLDPANCNPVIDAKSSSLFTNGIAWCDGKPLTEPSAVKTWFSQRRTALQAQLATVAAPFNVSSVALTNNVAVVSGTAPVGVQTIWFNGAQWPITWNSVSNWTVRIVLQPGTNQWVVQGMDPRGQPVTGAATNLATIYSDSEISPVGQVVINEIMYRPAIDGAQYVELFNNSSNFSFDLSGYQLKGLSYTFPPGSAIAPNGFLVLAANRSAFAAAYGATNLVFDAFNGVLQSDGETLTLLRPATNSVAEQIITKVQYSSARPWPQAATNPGTSLQLVDPRQDNWRVGNWGTGTNSFLISSLRTPDAPNSIQETLPAFPPLWINELEPENLTGPTNSVGQRVAWLELYNPTTNVVLLDGLFLSTNYSDLTAWPFPTGSVINPKQFKVIFTDGRTDLSTATELHTSFSLSKKNGSLALSRVYENQAQVLDFVDYADIGSDHSYGSIPDGQSFDRQEFAFATPGSTNDSTIPAAFIAYTTPGTVYQQNFDSLPDPGPVSVNSDNPVEINGVLYSLANPFGFADPVIANGKSGGLGIPDLAGWYGASASGSKFGATAGDQTTGGQISFGAPNSPNRALGLLATSSTGATSFGAKFINQSGQALHAISVDVTGELWRQSDLSKRLDAYYFIDSSGTSPFPTAPSDGLSGLNVSFPVNPTAIGGVAVDGTAGANQTHLSIVNQIINDWSPGSALWLVWQMADSTGKAQGLAIDNLSFAAFSEGPPPVPVTFQVSGTNLVLSWMGTANQTYQVEYNSDLRTGIWTPLGSPIMGAGAPLSFSADFTGSSQKFYRLRIIP